MIRGVAPGAPPCRIIDGWLAAADRVSSPNADERPAEASIELVVLHNISLPPGCYGGGHIAALFTNQLNTQAHPYFAQLGDVRVSAHLLIERTGRTIQFVPFGRRAWHAGVSRFEHQTACNDFSIGIEIEGSDFEAFTDLQYSALNAALSSIVAAYPIRAIRGHSDIAPDRKTDPGPYFDWDRLIVPPAISLPASPGRHRGE